MERETPKKEALLVLLGLTIGKTRSASKKGLPKAYRIWKILINSPVSIGA
jgi:hypothetical protein